MFVGNGLDTRKLFDRSTKYQLLTELVYVDHKRDGGTYIIPVGFESDGTTGFIRGRHTPASWIHDYALEGLGMSRSKARHLYNRAIKDCGTHWFMRRILVAAVFINDIRHKLI